MRTPPGVWPGHWAGFPAGSLDRYGSPEYARATDDLIAWAMRRSDHLGARQRDLLIRLETLGVRNLKDAEKLAVVINNLAHHGCLLIVAPIDVLQGGSLASGCIADRPNSWAQLSRHCEAKAKQLCAPPFTLMQGGKS